MVMPFCGTFTYAVIVPGAPQKLGQPWPVSLAEKFEFTGDSVRDDRLVGHSPTLTISDGGTASTPEKQYKNILRSRLTLTASRRKHATVSSASFYINKDITGRFTPGDLLYMSRTNCAGLGLSLIRNDELILAVGAVTAVHLGPSLKVKYPFELVCEAEAVFRKGDPDFEFAQSPLQFTLGTESRIVFGGFERLGEYKISQKHGHIAGMPGTAECVGIWTSARDAYAATSSAEMLESGHLDMHQW